MTSTPDLQAAVDSAHRSLSKQQSENVLIPRKHLRLILAALEERGKALEAYEAAKDRIAADSYDGIDDRSRELLETASQLARFAITALGGTADV